MNLYRRVFHRKNAEESHKELLYNKGFTSGKNLFCYSWFGIDPSMP